MPLSHPYYFTQLQTNTILEISYTSCQKYNTYNYIFNIHSISQT